MNPEIAASIFKEMLMTPVEELDQLPRRCGLQVQPRADDLEHARELLRAIIVGLQSAPGPNWDPIHTAWGAMVTKHGHVQESAMGPAPPQWVRDVPQKPSLGDAPPGVAAPMQPQMGAPPMQQQPLGYAPNPTPYAAPPVGPPPAAPVPMGQPPVPMGQAAQIAQSAPVPAPIPAHERGQRKVARTQPGAPLPPPPPGREAWPQPPAALHSGAPIAAPVGHQPSDAAPVYAAPEGYPVQQAISPMPAQQPPPQAPARQPSHPPQRPSQPYASPSQPAAAGYPPAQQVAAPVPSARGPAKTSQGDDIAMSVAKYAMFCAACAARPEQVFQTMVEFGVNSPQAREQLDESWQDRFDDDPALQQKWEQLFSQFRSQYK